MRAQIRVRLCLFVRYAVVKESTLREGRSSGAICLVNEMLVV